MNKTSEKESVATMFTLPNGLRCVHAPSCGEVSYIGLVVNAGSRDEAPEHDGLAHFVEHTLFKGTTHRSSWHISNRMESVGGELNAYTSKEETVIYVNAPNGNTARALELLSDIVANSCFPVPELDTEREVVIEEIKSYLDSPSDNVFDVFDEHIYASSRLAHNILGTPESVRAMKGEDCRAFLDKYYTPANMVLYIVDQLPVARAERIATKYFGHFHLQGILPDRQKPPMNREFFETIELDGHQSHTIMGVRTFSRTDPRRFGLFLLNNYLGGPCMNSRLNIELRERRGLVYTVESTLSLLSDCGQMQIYFGSDRAAVDRCRKLVMRQLEQLAENRMSEVKFERAKKQYLGQLTLSSDQRESMAMAYGKSLLYYGKLHTRHHTAERIRAVTAEELRICAEELIKTGINVLTIS